MVNEHDRIILAIREHIGAEEAVGVGGGEGVGVNEPADGRVIVAALEVVEAGLGIVVIAAVAQGVEVADRCVAVVVHRAITPGIIVVGRSEFAARIEDGGHVALHIEDVVVELRCLAVLVDHGEGLAAVVVDKLKRFAVPLLAHDLAGERRVGIGRIADLLVAADAGHVVGVGHLLAVHRRGGELAALRPREGIILAVVIRDRVAGGRDAARLGLAFVENVLRRAADCHAREQVGPRGVRVAKGLYDRAVGRDAADVAHRIVTAAAQRDAAGNDDDLWLCADGCTHHSDHLSISLRAVQQHRPLVNKFSAYNGQN